MKRSPLSIIRQMGISFQCFMHFKCLSAGNNFIECNMMWWASINKTDWVVDLLKARVSAWILHGKISNYLIMKLYEVNLKLIYSFNINNLFAFMRQEWWIILHHLWHTMPVLNASSDANPCSSPAQVVCE